MKAFLLRQVGAISRTYSVTPTPGEYLTVAVDASPWGMGGVLFDSQCDPKSWFATSITPEDTHRLQAIPGVCDFNTLWEALAILIALRLWGVGIKGANFHIRSDSLAACGAFVKLASRNPNLNLIAAELALDLSELVYDISMFTHIPGVTNTLADPLSRLWAPSPSEVPKELSRVSEAKAPARDREFWRSLAA